jgi:hypothetical protein
VLARDAADGAVDVALESRFVLRLLGRARFGIDVAQIHRVAVARDDPVRVDVDLHTDLRRHSVFLSGSGRHRISDEQASRVGLA